MQVQAERQFNRTCSAEKSFSYSESDFATMFVSPIVITKLAVSSSASLDTSMAVLEQISREYSRFYQCSCTELVLTDNEILCYRSSLEDTLPLGLTSPYYSVR